MREGDKTLYIAKRKKDKNIQIKRKKRKRDIQKKILKRKRKEKFQLQMCQILLRRTSELIELLLSQVINVFFAV